jgi:hypothetical protein
VDGAAGANLATQYLDGDLAQPLAAKPSVKILEAKLWVFAEERSKLAEQMLVARGVLVKLVGEQAQPISPLALLADLGEEGSVLLLEIAARRGCHTGNLRRRADAHG